MEVYEKGYISNTLERNSESVYVIISFTVNRRLNVDLEGLDMFRAYKYS